MTAISKPEKQTTLSGIKPSGPLHIGNYLGALRQFVAMQNVYHCYFFVADLHSLTEPYEPKEKTAQILDLTASFLAAGLDPKKSTIFLQSFIPEHTELAWIFSTITPVPELERMTQYKDMAKRKGFTVNTGLLTYPVFMAVDILIYKSTIIPVGDDQDQHLEITRTIARNFNRRFGETFPEPKPLHTAVPRLMSLDNPLRKMSKSEPAGCIFLNDQPAVIEQKIKRAVTDTAPPKAGEMSPGVANLFQLLQEFSSEETVKKFRRAYEDGSIRYSELKPVLAKDIIKGLKPFQKKYATLIEQPKKLMSVLESGSSKARKVAQNTLQEVKHKIGLPT